MANIQIPEELYYDIAKCILILERTQPNPIPEELYNRVKEGMITKAEAMHRRKEYQKELTLGSLFSGSGGHQSML